MTTEPYEEIVGRPQELDPCDPYTESGVRDLDCLSVEEGGCGAVAPARCTFETEEFRPGLGMVKVTKNRHSPCVVRITRKPRRS